MSEERIRKTISCKDSDYIPKVHNAGNIIDNFQIMHNGLKIVKGCYHGDWMSYIIKACKGHHEPQEEKAFYEVLKHIKEGSTMIEIGSFWAYYSMWFNRQINNAKNYMIDIDSHYLGIGMKNFEINGLKGQFSIDRLPNFKLENFMIDNKIQFVDVLHSDTQGWEFSLLSDSQKVLDKVGYIFVSTHTDKFTPGEFWGAPRELLHEGCLEFLQDNKFVILCEHNMKESASHDGLIVAKNPSIDPEFLNIEISKL